MEVTSALLKKYIDHTCTEEEKEIVERWLEDQKEELPDLSLDEIAAIKMEMWEDIASAIGAVPIMEAETEFLAEEGTKRKVSVIQKIIRYAAAAMLIFSLGVGAYYYLRTPAETEQFASTYKKIETRRGEKRTVKLSDGSTIRLNYESEVRVPTRFTNDERVVYLKGHAYFDVARDEDKPFIIYTEDTKTQVLGTSFEINTKERGETEIIVTSGKVAFSEKERLDNRVTLTVNDRALLNADKNLQTSVVDALALTAWKDNRLVFDGQTLREIVEVLEPWYDVRITVENPDLLEEDFILSLDNPPLASVLEDLSFASGLSYRIENKKVTIF
ncbi:MAG: FecR domain-containing protein [Bacteroidota bacterium]